MALPTKDELHTKAVSGEEITQDYVKKLTEEESSKSRIQAGGIAAMAQSIHDKQENFKAVASSVTSKPEAELSKEDASHIMSAESRAKDGIRPPKGSISAHVQSVADHNLQNQEQAKKA